MSNPAEIRLKNLIEEEKVIKSMLLQIKSKYYQLQVEHMALCKTQKNLLSKCKLHPVEVDHNINEVLNQPISKSVTEFSDNELINDMSSANVIEQFSELPIHTESRNYEFQSDKDVYEEDLDDPAVINQFILNDSHTQSALIFSEVDSSDEDLLK